MALFLVSISYQVWRLCNFSRDLNLSDFSGNKNSGLPNCKLNSRGGDKCWCLLEEADSIISKSECNKKCKKPDGTAECGSL